MNRDVILKEMSDLLERKGVPNKPVAHSIVRGDGQPRKQLINHHKRLMTLYKGLATPLLQQEYNILKFNVEKEEAERANQDSDQKSDSK